MRTEKEIKLERLTVDKAVKELMNECIKKWSKGQLDTSTIMELLSMPMIVFNALNWVLGDKRELLEIDWNSFESEDDI